MGYKGGGGLLSLGWTPNSLANLLAYYNAGLGITQSSGNISQWNDQSGNGNNLTVGTNGNLTWASNGFNTSFPGVSMTNNNFMNATLSFTPTSNLSYFILANFNPPAGASNPRATSLVASGDSVDNSSTTSCELIGSINNTDVVISAYNGHGPSLNPSPGILSYGIVGGGGNPAHQFFNFADQGGGGIITFSSVGNNPNALYVGHNNNVTFANNVGTTWITAYIILTTAQMSAGDITSLKAWTNANWGTSF